jgi:hypothetical protein
LLVRKAVRVHVQVIADESIEVTNHVRLRTPIGQLYSFFISASFTSARAPRTGTADRK